ncbi:MAG: AAA family ATPase, partial [Chthoniobacteraceae bacterium]
MQALLMAVNGNLAHYMSRFDAIGPQFIGEFVPMSASPPFLSISNAARLTGLEPGRIQFIQRELADWLPGAGDALGAEPIPSHSLDLLVELHERLFVRLEPIEAVRCDLQKRQRQLRVIAVSSGKGGVGKTNMAINVALALARQGSRVLLCDADLGLGNVHVYAGVTPTATLLDVVEGRAALRDILADGPGKIRVACGPSGVSELAQLDPEHIRRLGRELAGMAGDFDVVILDTGAGISPQVLQFLGMANTCIVVFEPSGDFASL